MLNSLEIIIYECGTEITDKRELRRFNKLCKSLALKSINIKRYSIGKDIDYFRGNEDLWCLYHCTGIGCLPATYVNGKIEKIEEYPTKREITGWLSAQNNNSIKK